MVTATQSAVLSAISPLHDNDDDDDGVHDPAEFPHTSPLTDLAVTPPRTWEQACGWISDGYYRTLSD